MCTLWNWGFHARNTHIAVWCVHRHQIDLCSMCSRWEPKPTSHWESVRASECYAKQMWASESKKKTHRSNKRFFGSSFFKRNEREKEMIFFLFCWEAVAEDEWRRTINRTNQRVWKIAKMEKLWWREEKNCREIISLFFKYGVMSSGCLYFALFC